MNFSLWQLQTHCVQHPQADVRRWISRELLKRVNGKDAHYAYGKSFTRMAPHPDGVRGKIIDLALDEPELSTGELAVRYTGIRRHWQRIGDDYPYSRRTG